MEFSVLYGVKSKNLINVKNPIRIVNKKVFKDWSQHRRESFITWITQLGYHNVFNFLRVYKKK